MLILDQLLESLERAEVRTDPFPYLVMPKLLEAKTYEALCKSYPTDEIYITANDLLTRADALWVQYISSLNTHAFHSKCLELLGSDLIIQPKDIGLRKVITDTPYVTESYTIIREKNENDWVLYPHIDSIDAITSMVHMFRSDDEKGYGCEFSSLVRNEKELQIIEDDNTMNYALPECFDVKDVIPYSPNAAVCMLVTDKQWHGIQPGSFNTRKTVNISMEHQNLGIRKK